MTDATAGRLLLAVAVLSGLALMSPLLAAGPLALDEHGSYWMAGAENPGTIAERSLGYTALPPLSSYVQRGLMAVLGKTEFVFRLSSALGYLLAIAFTYLLGRDLVGAAAGGLAALLLAWHPEVVDEVRIARCYGQTVMLAAASFWLTIRWMRRPDRLGWALAWAVVNAGLIWTHYLTVPVVCLEGVALLVMSRWSRELHIPPPRLLFVAGAVVLAAALPLLPSVLRNWEWSPFLNYQREGSPLWEIVGAFWWLGLPVGWVVARLMSRRQTERRYATMNLWCAGLWCLAPLAAVVLVSQGDLTSLANPRYRIAYAVPAAVFVAGCLLHRRSNLAGALGGACAIATTWLALQTSPVQLERLGEPNAAVWREMAQIVKEQGRPGEPLVVHSGLVESYLVPALYEDELLMDYAACRLGTFYLPQPHPRTALPFLWTGAHDLERFYIEHLRDACSRQQRVWVAATVDTDLNETSLAHFRDLLARHGFREVQVRNFNSAVLIEYECPRSP